MSAIALLNRPIRVGVETKTKSVTVMKPILKSVKPVPVKSRAPLPTPTPTLLSPQKKEWRKVLPEMELAQKELVNLLGGILTSTSLKSRGSCFEKLERKGYSSFYQLTDLVRGEIEVGTTAQVVQAVYWLKSVLSESDLVSIEKVEAKVGESYHGVAHIDLRINGVGVEMKVMTYEAKKAHGITHSWYKQGVAEKGLKIWETVSNFSEEELVAIELLG